MISRQTKRALRDAALRALCLLLPLAIAVGMAPGDADAYLSTAGPPWDWYWQNPLPQGNGLGDVFFVSESIGYAVGLNGTLLRTDTGGAVWEAQAYPSGPHRRHLHSVHFADATTGWAVGNNGIILATTNGGNTWSEQTSGTNQHLRSVHFADATTGWAVGAGGTILTTTNGGTNWSAQTSGTTNQLHSVHFADATTGWAVGDSGIILATTNGGTSWSAQTSGTGEHLHSVHFADATTGWAVGRNGAVLRTDSGGASWEDRTGVVGNPQLRSIRFAKDSDSGWMVGDSGHISKTTDAGDTWISQEYGATNRRNLGEVAAISDTHACVVGDDGRILLTTDGGTTWRVAAKPGPGSDHHLYGLEFVDPSNGWAVGVNGVILRTADGGGSWETFISGVAHLWGVSFVDKQTGWAVGDEGTILVTTNGGTNWSAQTSGTTNQLHSVHFADATTGWAVGAGGTILTTTNGGTSWSAQTSGTTNQLHSVHFADATTGWAVGAGGTILATTNGGTSWSEQTSGTNQHLRSVHFTDAETGWAVGSGGIILATTNGGTSWSAQTSGTGQLLWSVHFTDAETGWAVGHARTILKTTNGGDDWDSVETCNLSSTAIIYGVHFTNATTGWLVGNSGTVRRTADGGQTWNPMPDHFNAGLNDLAFHDEDTGWAVGTGGRVRRTRDGGLTWGTLFTMTSSHLYGTSFVDASTGWAVGDSGTVIKTTDAGDTWSEQTSGTTNQLHSVHFADATTGWAVGDSGIILATTNGGTNWSEQTSGTTNQLHSVHFADATTGWAVGDSGTVIKTTDAGDTWIAQTSGTTNQLHSVHFADATTGWVVGDSGTVIKTTDAGDTWIAQTSNTTSAINSVHFIDENTGWAVGAAGTVRKTTDGGENWTSQLASTGMALSAVALVETTATVHGWAVGALGLTLKTTSETPPDTIATLEPADPDGNEGWFVASPSITLQRNKPGITKYSWDSDSGPWSTYVDPIDAPEGEATLYYYSIGTASNAEDVRALPIKVDSEPPTPPGSPSAIVEGATAIELSWSASSDPAPGSGIAYYEVYMDGSLETTTADTVATISDLEPGTEYGFQILALDVAGNSSAKSDPVFAKTDSEDVGELPPHVPVEENPDTCAMCHRSHTAMGTVSRTDHSNPWETIGSALVVATPSDMEDAALCLSCHGVEGLGSETNVHADFIRASAHSIAPQESAFGPSPKRCSSCHDAHGSERDGEGQPYARLLRAFTEAGTVFFTGEEYCTTCHFDSRDEEGNRFDGLDVYSLTAHATMEGPVSGTEITCSICHAPHGSDFAPLIRDVITWPTVSETATVEGNDRTLCYACHTEADEETTWDGEETYELSVHGSSVMTVSVVAEWASEETSRVAGECQNCHNPMGRDDGRDEGRLVPKLGEVEGRELCYSCHNEESEITTDMASIAVPDVSFGEELVVSWDPLFLPEEYGALHVYTRETTDTPSPLEGPRRFRVNGRTGAVAYGDISGDDTLELVVADPDAAVLYVFRHDPLDPLEVLDVTAYEIEEAATFLEIGDFLEDGSGLPEVAAVSVDAEGESRLRLYRFNGSAFSRVEDPISVGKYASGLASGDLSNDGAPELVVTSLTDDPSGPGELHIIGRSEETTHTTRVAPRGPSIGDVITGESGNEIVVANSGETTGTVSVFLADGTEHSNYDTALPAGAAAWDTAVGAFRPGPATGVGVAVRNETGDSGVCVFPAGVTELGSRADYVTGARYASSSLAVGDVDGDGRAQLVVGNAGVLTTATAESVSPSVQVFRVNESNNLVLGDELWAGGTEIAGGTPGLAVADLGPVGRSRHPVGAVEKTHVSTETAGFDRHVECADCHNVHAATTETTSAPNVYGVLTGAWGVDISGEDYELKEGVDYEYEVCFKCHGDESWSSAPRDIEAEFSRTSSHPVVESPQLYCVDCHGNADTEQASGPHVSPAWPLLSSPLIGVRPADGAMLCYGSGCHAKSLYHDGTDPASETDFRQNETNLHVLHVGAGNDGYGIGCEACHLSHGSGNDHLIRDGLGWSVNETGPGCSVPCHGDEFYSY